MDVSRSNPPASPIAAAPRPQPGAPPGSASHAPTKLTALGEDRIDGPVARRLGAPPHSGPPKALDSLPLLVAGTVVAGGVAVVAAPVVEAGLAASEGLAALATGVARSGGYLADFGRAVGPAFRTAAAKFTDVNYRDPKELGKTVGEQAWTAIEEVGRGSLTGAGLAGGVAVAHQLGAAVMHAIDTHRPHAER